MAQIYLVESDRRTLAVEVAGRSWSLLGTYKSNPIICSFDLTMTVSSKSLQYLHTPQTGNYMHDMSNVITSILLYILRLTSLPTHCSVFGKVTGSCGTTFSPLATKFSCPGPEHLSLAVRISRDAQVKEEL
jgi:hypothetical protein